MAEPITTIIVDDESPARDAIRRRLMNDADVHLLGEAASGPEAVDLLRALKPDLVFMDIQMPGLDGFQVIERVAPLHQPLVVFVTASDRYALRAFETHAIDYLLKPFTAERFDSALDRVRLEIAKSAPEKNELRMPQTQPSAIRLKPDATGAYPVRLAVKRDQRISLIRTRDINWIESSANYACLHVDSESYVVRMTMNELERQLDPQKFARIHRSSIVQIDRIKDIVPVWHGDFDVTLRDGTVLRLTRNYRTRLLPD